jgi:transcriptional regulator with XRE-family HTH domain
MSTPTLEQLVEQIVERKLAALGVVQAPTPAALRIKGGYSTPAALAIAAGIPPATVRKYEAGRLAHVTGDTLRNFQKLAELIGTDAQTYAAAVESRKVVAE